MNAACIHELDVVRLREPSTGQTVDGDEIGLPAGTTGTVILERMGAPVVEVEVVDRETGETVALVAVSRSALDLVWRSGSRTEAA